MYHSWTLMRYYDMIKRLCIACVGLMLLSSCGEYYRVQKSSDLNERYSFAKKSYNEKKYGREYLPAR